MTTTPTMTKTTRRQVTILRLLPLALALILASRPVTAFDIPNPFQNAMAGRSVVGGGKSKILSQTKQELWDAASFTNNGKDASMETQQKVLSLVRQLETKATKTPIPPKLLTDEATAMQFLDGTWYLKYTAPYSIAQGEDVYKVEDFTDGGSVPSKAYSNKGAVSAAGLKVDTSNKETKQIFDVVQSRVTNKVDLDFGKVVVGGRYRVSDNVDNRAVVTFDTCEITLNNGFVINLGWLFAILAKVRGTTDSGWLETSYIDDDFRVGRGNAGTLFLLTRDPSAIEA
uniref:Plastid lipid-associated protein/fibrillin conserved domain-containing protein n=1 Tax=Craspedostauros australis TaxID=1486917 RepID=A0A7R9ZJX0_9STRA|mmetsp:Transcript_13016/g.35914  ORF Transcript_13016/g.35914 Transcript_13016/m.35914 type:complete len:285 (+) Transcript_13016:135-989(+)|eukprot:CAMPEP_0198119696 /NCGR_PEP_ID=MMETSP1442-20131203/26674_1 /TAXON_ID= /ORGANISM="Craspedostauros australis, Strain CCMP3328" /LENGTH=284 /DNA_ID=CAMNT_0043778217 /DNA_START=117 /DNA_END=971 /DNA_ORIENTATION=+